MHGTTVTSETVTATRHADATRRAILTAGAELLMERGDDGFAVQEVAKRAGLTHRTVYRYFATRRDLLAAIAHAVAPEFGDDFEGVRSVRDWLSRVGDHLARTEANLALVRRVLAAALASDELVHGDDRTRGRDAQRWEVFRAEFPNLGESEARRTFATLRHLTSSSSYLLYRLRFGMSPAEALDTIQAAASQLVGHAAARNRELSRGVAGGHPA